MRRAPASEAHVAGGATAGRRRRAVLPTLLAIAVALVTLGGCGGTAPGQEIVDRELDRIEDSVLEPAEVRRFEREYDDYTCDSGASFYAKRGFITLDDRGLAAVSAAFVKEYRARGWAVQQYRSGDLDVVRLIATRPDDALTVDVGIRSSGGIDLGTVRYSPCGEEYKQGFIGPDWVEEPVGT